MAARKPPVEMVLCGERLSAEQVAGSLRGLGYHQAEIERLVPANSRTVYYLLKAPQERRLGPWTVMLAGMGLGGAIGSMIVGIMGSVMFTGMTLAIPAFSLPVQGMQDLFVSGEVMGGLTGAGAGGVFGGTVGLFIGFIADLRKSFGRLSPMMIAAVPEDAVKDRPNP